MSAAQPRGIIVAAWPLTLVSVSRCSAFAQEATHHGTETGGERHQREDQSGR